MEEWEGITEAKCPTLIYEINGKYSYERETEPDIEYTRYLNDRDVCEWLEHAFQLVTPYTHVRIVMEVVE